MKDNNLRTPLLRPPHALLAAMTVFATMSLGYHPYAEDGGVYIAGVKWLLNPSLYPRCTAFVTEHLRFSLFAPAMALLTRALHIGLPWALLLIYAASLWGLLYAVWKIAVRCFPNPEETWARAGAVALSAAWCGLPIAGTSLMLMDPYVTARSLSTPLSLLAVAAAMEKNRSGLFRCGLWLGLTACFHPLMAVYALAFVVLLLCAQAERRQLRCWLPIALGILALAAATVLQLVSPHESAAQTAVAVTRYYWFPGRWEIYELIGLPAPLLILAVLRRYGLQSPRAAELIAAILWLGIISTAIAAVFAHVSFSSHVIARLQPLRCFQTVYIAMILVLGGWLAQRWLRGRAVLACLLLPLAACGLFFGQRQYYPASTHIEMPWRIPHNQWVLAFLWARQNTPIDALFALDANYITTDGEDAQCFRAIAERSALPDYSKDGGVTAITPELTGEWTIGSTAQTGLSKQTDAERRAKLLPLGVSWIILQQHASTSLNCPYTNGTVKICRLL